MDYPVYDLFMHLSRCAHNPSKHLLSLLSPFIHLPICKKLWTTTWIAITFYTEDLYKICNVTSVFMQTKQSFKSTLPKDMHDFLCVSWVTYLLEWKTFKIIVEKNEKTYLMLKTNFWSSMFKNTMFFRSHPKLGLSVFFYYSCLFSTSLAGMIRTKHICILHIWAWFKESKQFIMSDSIFVISMLPVIYCTAP
jgi:hypothetical protein